MQHIAQNNFVEINPALCLGKDHDALSVTAEDFEQEFKRRSIRSQFLPADLFAEAGWEMLLFLALRHAQQRRTTVSEACKATCAPYASAWRWLNRLMADDLIVVRQDPLNRRRKFVELTTEAFTRISLAVKMQRAEAAEI